METMVEPRCNSRSEICGNELREMFGTATTWLEKNEALINALNVFPVPDGDTGTNMLLTMKAVIDGVSKLSETGVCEMAQAMAKSALMGARGNSGVILSQIIRGFANGLNNRDILGLDEMAEALEQASLAAYASMSTPREGTILTVIKGVASAAGNGVAGETPDLISLMEMVVEEARNSVQRTPELLDVLKNAGVVDAGGQGLYIILEGMLCYLRDGGISIDAEEIKVPAFGAGVINDEAALPVIEEAYGYCTELILKGDELKADQIRRWVESQGQSAMVVGAEDTVKVHVHTFHPGTVIEFALSLGTVHDLKIQNMDDQHKEFRQYPEAEDEADGIAIVAVAAGEGMQSVFRSLGASAIISGGQTMNPSCADILKAIDSVSSGQVIVLPNNKNIIPSARQAAEASSKEVMVLPTRSIPQGLSALVGFNKGAGLAENVAGMTRNQEQVRSVEITAAVRDARVNGLEIRKGNYIGIIDSELRVARNSLNETIFDSLEKADAASAGIVSVFYGSEVKDSEAGQLADSVRKEYPGLEVEVLPGSQPHYYYIISVEKR